ncbi:carboxylesterase family protein [Marinilongibacter aquaticus]|uniref:carboxylesterase/lipase family protein n=1 Tax=Marinilongibacter aquaticus TaxID=2975157 RepID=UPI0021BDBC7F|nr:carboxylesterase family protein [Marinilongibacter aquaticus]UBM59680.1 carboxylesterase family protein [Marinilongibacter aquaticus]
MKRHILAFAALALFGFACQSPTLDIVQTNSGQISGSLEDSVHIFKGIPFAKPPVGDLRWKAPQSPEPWDGVKDCSSFSASPMQRHPEPFFCWTEEFISPPEPLSEDCLYLNVWTAAQKAEERRPVFVWIYGGGFNSGSAACAIYDGKAYAKRGVVFISLNYRVGALGFLAHPALSQEQEGHSGNYGLLDQIAALKWVQENIASFGGDPNNVTIAGQSAGSMSVNALVASPLAKGLFQKAIAQSGGLLGNRLKNTLSEAESQGEKFEKVLKAENLADLLALPAESIQMAYDTAGIRMLPALDDYVLPKNVEEHFGADKHNDVPTMVGWVTGDGALLSGAAVDKAAFLKNAQETYGKDTNTFLTLFPTETDKKVQEAKHTIGLIHFAVLPAYIWAQTNKKNPTFVYEVTHVPTDKPDFPNYGAFHTSEVPYALHNLHTWQRPWQAHDYSVEETMSNYWLNFIKTGNPNGPNALEWQAFDPAKDNVMVLDSLSQMAEGKYKAAVDFFRSHRD